MLFNTIDMKLLESQNYSYRKQQLSVAAGGERDQLQSGMEELLGDDGNVAS